MVFEIRKWTLYLGDVDPCDLEIGLVDEVGTYGSSLEIVWCNPGLDDKHASGSQMSSHVLNSPLHPLSSSQMTDGAEETSYDIVLCSQFETRHVSTMEDHIRMFLLCNAEHIGTGIYSFDKEFPL